MSFRKIDHGEIGGIVFSLDPGDASPRWLFDAGGEDGVVVVGLSAMGSIVCVGTPFGATSYEITGDALYDPEEAIFRFETNAGVREFRLLTFERDEARGGDGYREVPHGDIAALWRFYCEGP